MYKDGVNNVYKMNIWFARGTEAFGYYYYRCFIYDIKTNKQIKLFYGLVNTTGGRTGCSKKASLICASYYATAQMAKDAAKGYLYIEPILNVARGVNSITTQKSSKNSFEATLYGDIVFQYQKGGGLVPVTSKIKG